MIKTVFPTGNGVVVHCEDKKVFSAINCDGHKKLKSFRAKNKIIFWHFPFMRGFQYFFCGIAGLFQALLLSYDICHVPNKVKGKNIDTVYIKKLVFAAIAVVLGFAYAAFILGYVPGKLGYLIVGFDGNFLLRNFVIATLKILLFFLLLSLLRCFPIMNEFFRFNRAGDVALLHGENFKQNKKHFGANPTNFLNYVVFVYFLDFLVVTLWGAGFGFWFNLVFHLALWLLCISLGYEILWVMGKCKWSFVRNLAYFTEYFVYAKPTTTHFETALVAVVELNLLCSQKGREFMDDENKKAFSVVYTEVKNKLTNAGINEKSDVDWLIATVLNKNRAEIKLVPFVTDKQYQDILKAADRRAKGESLDNIFGYTEFFGLRFDVNKKVLTPRMETEILVEQVLKAEKTFKNPQILDLGTGSGAIAVSIAKNSRATVTALDVSKSALMVAESNAEKNGVKIEFIYSNLFEGLKRKRKFDIIVSNPPYIPTEDISKLDKNVKDCDPMLALDGGEDGLDFYRKIVADAGKRLTSGGLIFFEVGKGHAAAVRKLLKENGFEEIKTTKDYNKIERVICGKYR